MSLPEFRRLGETGPIIISHEEITCCYLVKSKSVIVTDISEKFAAKMIRYQKTLIDIKRDLKGARNVASSANAFHA